MSDEHLDIKRVDFINGSCKPRLGFVFKDPTEGATSKTASKLEAFFSQFHLQDVVCHKIKNHARQMAKFATNFKAILHVLKLDSTELLPDFLKTTKTTAIIYRFSDKLNKLSNSEGHFPDFLPSCGCNSVSPASGVMPELFSRDANGHDFCYHRPLSAAFLNLYSQARDFILTVIRISEGFEKMRNISSLLPPADDFKTLTQFKTCPCVRVIHARADFHQLRFSGQCFLPAVFTFGVLLERISWKRVIMDFRKFGASEDFFNSLLSRDIYTISSRNSPNEKVILIISSLRIILNPKILLLVLSSFT